MKKGNYAPRTRARWQHALVDAGRPNCPTWLRVTEGDWFYLNPSIPAAEAVHPFNMRPARWNYQTNGMVFYQGVWDNLIRTGKWVFGMMAKPDPPATFNLFGLTIDSAIPGTDLWWLTSSAPDEGMLFFNPVVPIAVPTSVDIVKGSAWLTHGPVAVDWLNYDGIRAIGENPDDTSPLTWSGVVWPP